MAGGRGAEMTRAAHDVHLHRRRQTSESVTKVSGNAESFRTVNLEKSQKNPQHLASAMVSLPVKSF